MKLKKSTYWVTEEQLTKRAFECTTQHNLKSRRHMWYHQRTIFEKNTQEVPTTPRTIGCRMIHLLRSNKIHSFSSLEPWTTMTSDSALRHLNCFRFLSLWVRRHLKCSLALWLFILSRYVQDNKNGSIVLDLMSLNLLDVILSKEERYVHVQGKHASLLKQDRDSD